MSKHRRHMKAVLNHEEQVRIVPVERELPLGWKDLGKGGSVDEVRAMLLELAATGDNRVDMDRIEDLLDEEDRTTSTAADRNPHR
jgi:hypothetical protein